MNILQDPGHWQSYLKKYQNNKIPLAEIKRMYLQEQNQFQMQMMQMQNSLQSAQSSGASKPQIVVNPLPSNCIQFVVNTYEGLNHYSNITSSGPTDYSVDWGDGNIETGTIDGAASINHDYPDLGSPTSYTVRLCFSDASLITSLDFPGNN